MLLGVAIAGRSLGALALVAVFAVFVERYVRLEEQQLARDFGAAYERYRAQTPRFVPLLAPRAAGASERASTK